MVERAIGKPIDGKITSELNLLEKAIADEKCMLGGNDQHIYQREDGFLHASITNIWHLLVTTQRVQRVYCTNNGSISTTRKNCGIFVFYNLLNDISGMQLAFGEE